MWKLLLISTCVQFTLSRRLNYKPGSKYSYSNLGYGILGEIIARKSGMPYQDYVVMNLLKPLEIHDMHIGKSYYHEKYPNEVRYHSSAGKMTTYSMDGSGERVPIYYGGNNIELLGPAGGWVASAPELIKFLTAIDGFPEQPDILNPETVQLMSDPEFAGKGLFGWRGSNQVRHLVADRIPYWIIGPDGAAEGWIELGGDDEHKYL